VLRRHIPLGAFFVIHQPRGWHFDSAARGEVQKGR
jgi:hypothetical protein